MENKNPVKSVEKAMKLLDTIIFSDVSGEGKTLKDLADRFGLPVNTAHNLLKSLEMCGYIARRERGLYVAGPKCKEMGRAVLVSSIDGRLRIIEILEGFVEKEGEAVVCTILLEGERVTVAKVESNQAIRVAHSMVETAPFFSKPTGRVLAAMADEVALEKILERQAYPGEHWDGISNSKDLEKALQEVRETGVSKTTEDDLVALACAVFQPDGSAWGAIGTYAPAFRCNGARQKELTAALKDTAQNLSSILGSL